MGVTADFPSSHDYLIRDLEKPVLAAFADFDSACGPPGWTVPPEAVFGGLDDDGRRLLGRWVQLRLSLGTAGGHEYDERLLRAVRFVADGDIPWTIQDVHFLWGVANGLMVWGHTRFEELYRIPLAASRCLSHAKRRRILERLPRWYKRYHGPAWEVLEGHLAELLTESDENDPAARVRNLIWDCDPFARMLSLGYGSRLGGPAVHPLLRHWTTAVSAEPSATWTRVAAGLLTPQAIALTKEILGRLAAYREETFTNEFDYRETVFLHERTARPLRGMVWTCELIDEPWVTPLLGDVALTCGTGLGGAGADCRSEMLANAAVTILGARGGLGTVAPLARLQATVRDRSLLANVSRALDGVATVAGLSREHLLDRTTPDLEPAME